MKKITTSFLLFTFMLLIHGCTQQETSEFTDWAIIETYIQPGDYLNVKVTRQLPFSSDVEYAADDINNLSITVTSDNIVYNLTPLGDGIYIDSSLIVAENAEYTLSFLFSVYIHTFQAPEFQTICNLYICNEDRQHIRFSNRRIFDA
mgnify:CR=1 FL=1